MSRLSLDSRRDLITPHMRLFNREISPRLKGDENTGRKTVLEYQNSKTVKDTAKPQHPRLTSCRYQTVRTCD